MPKRRPHPVSYLAENGTFPQGPYQWETPWEVFLAAALAIRLKAKTDKESVRYYANKAGVSPQTILNILNGTTWPDLRTIARLEIAVDGKLWGNEHRVYRTRTTFPRIHPWYD